ncbi:MAG: hypothetical protein AUG51_24900 [Acidobacteria bacterium 13_1_20CM_3_53_8]|nr:MAG: hypothetical protein AUG51_24900 [Acidobacteria bacterium 13_1_20CM_3_53_8]
MILSLQTNTFGWYGGIPTYNRLICRALNEMKTSAKSRVLIAMDEREKAASQDSLYSNLFIEAFNGDRIQFVKRVLRIAAKRQTDVILASHINYAPLCSLVKFMRPQARVGIVIYGWEVWRSLPLLQKRALRHANFIISISEYTKQRAIEVQGIEGQRVFVLPNALEWKETHPTRIPGNCSFPPGVKLLSVGRLDAAEQQKGFDTVIRALPKIANQVPDIQYIVIGDGTDLERHKQLAKKLGVSERVHFLGFVDDDLLRQAYAACDLFVMPSAQEGFGFVYLEAMQYGKAVVAANSGGAPEVVTDGETGWLVEYGNTEQLSQALIRLCLDSELRAKLGDAGYHRLQKSFTFPKFCQTFSDILKRELSAIEIYKSRRKMIGNTQAV